MTDENSQGFFSRIARGIGNVFRSVWHGIKYVGLGLTQIAGGVVGVGPGVGSGVSKIVGGTESIYDNVLAEGIKSTAGNGAIIGWSLSDVLAKKTPAEIRAICNQNPAHTLNLIQDALQDGDTFSLTRFLDTGVNLNVCVDGNSPLLLAVKQNNPELVKMMLQHGANPNLKGIAEAEASATSEKSFIIADMLFAHGAQTDSPLFGYLIANAKVRALLQQKQTENQADNNGIPTRLQQVGEVYRDDQSISHINRYSNQGNVL